LLAGHLIFIGTPPGVGMALAPARYLTGDTTLVSATDGVGELPNRLLTE
jgi:2-keto-4-pentenoate hydratase/2-oxohepta-3-ene-1,7-dioic acid hydratase in catechol pathway